MVNLFKEQQNSTKKSERGKKWIVLSFQTLKG